MECFSTDRLGRVFVVRLDPGDCVLESINELVSREKVRDAVVISAVGTLNECTLHMVTTTDYPPKEYFKQFKNKPLELVSLTGIIADGKPHLHAVVSDCERTYAGHLERLQGTLLGRNSYSRSEGFGFD